FWGSIILAGCHELSFLRPYRQGPEVYKLHEKRRHECRKNLPIFLQVFLYGFLLIRSDIQELSR
ncbi:2730_t:CDS:1, partial [Scutellospora calospora]